MIGMIGKSVMFDGTATPYWFRQINTENNMLDTDLHWQYREMVAGYCLDAPDLLGAGPVKVAEVPKYRHDPVRIIQILVLIRPYVAPGITQ